MNWGKVAEGAIGLFLILPFEDVATGFTSTPATAVVGALMLADAFGFKL